MKIWGWRCAPAPSCATGLCAPPLRAVQIDPALRRSWDAPLFPASAESSHWIASLRAPVSLALGAVRPCVPLDLAHRVRRRLRVGPDRAPTGVARRLPLGRAWCWGRVWQYE